ncbi:hypothetical protein C7H19_18985 [Aphanothece hegewaldii CCALA 016]|uniref:Uncharacterized protein n=1 Tax=Aphanothece hegewaldii CCALA 016 TaxID=2107694 RepID=A0A2T1LTT6_9CHRO|nr:tetratricopeptide repeat protein [Aphanothece hegewaldii]PSF34513.1 hypothetical protein C7H19_18985 [Aphanothece hegewaldii CCALA 016]
MYHQILEGLREFMGFESVESPVFAEYLQSLQESVIKLRQAYKTNSVQIDYTASNIQAAYMLAYFPQYVDMAYEIFKSLETFQDSNTTENLKDVIERKLFENEQGLTACFFAAGPAPESVALCKYITEYFINEQSNLSNKIQLNTFDINWHSWSLSRHLTRSYVLSECNSLITGLIPHQINLLSKEAFSQYEEQIIKADILFFQNCLNEVVKEKEKFLNNFEYLLNQINEDTILIIGDFCNYPSVIELFKEIEDIVAQNCTVIILRSSNLENIHIRHNICLPEIIKNNLLTGANNLIPRKNVSFNYLVIYKPCSEERIQANYYYNLGNQKIEEQKHKEAIENFTKALIINPNFANAYSKRGIAKLKLKEELEISAEFLEYQRIDAYYTDRVLYAEINQEASEVDKKILELAQEALEDFTEAITINHNNVENYYKRGIINYDLGHYQEAFQDLTEVIKFKPNDANNYYKRGIINYDLGHYQEAFQDLTEAININPDLSIAYYYKDLALYELERSRKTL